MAICNSYRSEELEQLFSKVPIKSDDIVLDALCGNGFASSHLVGKVERVVAIDSKKRPTKFPKGIEYSQQEVQSLDFNDETFSLVLAHTGFHHIGEGNPEEQKKSLKEFYRVLKNGGVLRLADLEGETKASETNDKHVPGHGKLCLWLTPESSISLLRDAGFSEVQAESVQIKWTFKDKSHLEEIAKTVFKVDSETLKEYGLVRGSTMELPFIYVRGVKK